MDRYSFIVSDLHRLLSAGLPAHCERNWTLPRLGCDYIIGFAINSKLLEVAALWREQCDWRRLKFKPTVRRFHQLSYQAREWSRSRKLVARVEATALGTDVRFIVTSLEGRGKTLYEKVFCPVATPRT